MEEAVEAAVDPELALGHRILPQVVIQGEGAGPVKPNDRQVAAH